MPRVSMAPKKSSKFVIFHIITFFTKLAPFAEEIKGGSTFEPFWFLPDQEEL